MADWVIREHPEFFRDLDKLSKDILNIFYKKKEKLKQDPERLKHLHGGANCYREQITSNIRLVYFIEGDVIWLLTIGPHDKAYEEYLKRLYSLREKFGG